jgi:ribosomal protein S18 acetylase RimI-like enzyme
VIRNLQPEDYDALSALAKLSFPATQSRFVTPGEAGGIVITVDGTVVAASLLRIIGLPSGRKVGVVAWLMTHPEWRGRGFASTLVEASTEHLTSIQCEDVVTDVEGYNTGSANAFYRAGYRRLSVGQQVRRWNPIDLLWLSIKTGFAVDPGHFYWVYDAPNPRNTPYSDRLVALAFNALLAVVAFSLGGGLFLSGSPLFSSIYGVAAFGLGVCSLLVVREGGMRIVAWLYRTPLEFRAWTGGWGISLLIAIGFGSLFPLPGNVYPRGDRWRVQNYQDMFGWGAVVSVMLAAFLVMVGSVLRDTATHEFWGYLGLGLVFVGKPLLIFDTLVAIAPFEGFNGRHLRDYSRLVWLALSALAVVLFIWA